MALDVHTRAHADPPTPCGTTARPATRTFTKSDGQICNRRLLTKRLTPWQGKCMQLWVVEFTARRWGERSELSVHHTFGSPLSPCQCWEVKVKLTSTRLPLYAHWLSNTTTTTQTHADTSVLTSYQVIYIKRQFSPRLHLFSVQHSRFWWSTQVQQPVRSISTTCIKHAELLVLYFVCAIFLCNLCNTLCKETLSSMMQSLFRKQSLESLSWFWMCFCSVYSLFRKSIFY